MKRILQKKGGQVLLCLILVGVLVGIVYAQGSAILPYITTFMRTLLDDATAGAGATTLGLGVNDTVTHDALVLDGTIATGLDMSGGTFATGTQNWPTQFVIKANGTKVFHNFKHPTGGGAIPEGRNTFIGIDSGNLTMGSTATSAWQSSNNTGIGNQALQALTLGAYNVGMGRASSYSLTTGDHNIAVGFYSAFYNVTGSYNTIVGSYAGQGATGNSYSANSLFGYTSGYRLSTGSDNVFLGMESGYYQTTNSNLLIIDNRPRGGTGAPTDSTRALIYGVFAAAAANQSLRINGEILGSDGATIGDVATNNVVIGVTGNLSFVGSAGFYPRFLTQTDEPAAGTGATQCDTSEMVVWKDSDDSKVYMCFNDGGTVKSVELP